MYVMCMYVICMCMHIQTCSKVLSGSNAVFGLLQNAVITNAVRTPFLRLS